MKYALAKSMLASALGLATVTSAVATTFTVPTVTVPYNTRPAGILTQNLIGTGLTINDGPFYPGVSLWVDLPSFDSSLGTLEKVEVQWNAGVEGTVGVLNEGAGFEFPIQATLAGESYLLRPGFAATPGNSLLNADSAVSSPMFGLAPSASNTESLSSGPNFFNDEYTDAALLAAVNLDGIVTVPWYLGALAIKGTISSAEHLVTTAEAYAYGDLKLVYTYSTPGEEVPEASTNNALASLLGVGGFWYARKRNAARAK